MNKTASGYGMLRKTGALVAAVVAAATVSAEAKFGMVDMVLLVRNHPSYDANKELLTSTDKDFQKFVDPLYKYINETESRVPISDWHDTKTGRMTGFKARSVIGGYWMRVLMNKK